MNRVIFDVNSQVGYINNDPNVIESIQFIIIGAIEENIPVIGTVLVDDYINHPKHKETLCAHETNIYFVPNIGHGIDMGLSNNVDQIYFETRKDVVEQSDNINTYLRTNNIDTISIIGVDNINSLETIVSYFGHNMKYKIELIYDAISIDLIDDYMNVSVISAQELINDLGQHNG